MPSDSAREYGPLYQCKGCGQRIQFRQGFFSVDCPYCGEILEPEGVYEEQKQLYLPFGEDLSNEAQALGFLKKKHSLPFFFRHTTPKGIYKLYVPAYFVHEAVCEGCITLVSSLRQDYSSYYYIYTYAGSQEGTFRIQDMMLSACSELPVEMLSALGFGRLMQNARQADPKLIAGAEALKADSDLTALSPSFARKAFLQAAGLVSLPYFRKLSSIPLRSGSLAFISFQGNGRTWKPSYMNLVMLRYSPVMLPVYQVCFDSFLRSGTVLMNGLYGNMVWMQAGRLKSSDSLDDPVKADILKQISGNCEKIRSQRYDRDSDSSGGDSSGGGGWSSGGHSSSSGGHSSSSGGHSSGGSFGGSSGGGGSSSGGGAGRR